MQQINIWDKNVQIQFLHNAQQKDKANFITIPADELEQLVAGWDKKNNTKSQTDRPENMATDTPNNINT